MDYSKLCLIIAVRWCANDCQLVFKYSTSGKKIYKWSFSDFQGYHSQPMASNDTNGKIRVCSNQDSQRIYSFIQIYVQLLTGIETNLLNGYTLVDSCTHVSRLSYKYPRAVLAYKKLIKNTSGLTSWIMISLALKH